MCEEKNDGMSYNDLSQKHKIRTSRVKYIVRLIEKHGYDILLKNIKINIQKIQTRSNRKSIIK